MMRREKRRDLENKLAEMDAQVVDAGESMVTAVIAGGGPAVLFGTATAVGLGEWGVPAIAAYVAPLVPFLYCLGKNRYLAYQKHKVKAQLEELR